MVCVYRRLRPLYWVGLVLLTFVQSVVAEDTLRIGLTPTFLNERHALMADWRAYLERKLGRPVAFVLNDSYQETIELLNQQRLQVAWLCDCPHVTSNRNFRLLATPQFLGRPYYRAYLIVPDTDHTTGGMLDLKGKVFAYSDPYSNVGHLNPRYQLKKQGADPDHFFRRTFFTRSHRKAIEAVAVGVADASSVNSYIWETLHQQGPALTGRTRVAAQSEEFGFPPIVAYHTFPLPAFHALQQALVTMADDVQGREVLKKMNLDGFVLPQPEIYRPVQDIVRYMEKN